MYRLEEDKSKYDAELKLYHWYASASNTLSDWQKAAWELNRFETFRFMRRRLLPLDGKLGLELGCGREGLAPFFQKEGMTLIECDLIVESLYDLRNRDAENLVAGDANSLPFRDDRFDFVFCIGLIHHLHPIEIPLGEMMRILKPCGYMYVFEPNKHYFLTIMIESLPASWTRRLRQVFLTRILKNYVPATPYERPLSARKVGGILEELRIEQVAQFFNSSPHPSFPKALAFLYNGMANTLTKVFPFTSKWLSWEWMIIGRKSRIE